MTPQTFGMTLIIALLGFGLTIVLCAAAHGEVEPTSAILLRFSNLQVNEDFMPT